MPAPWGGLQQEHQWQADEEKEADEKEGALKRQHGRLLNDHSLDRLERLEVGVPGVDAPRHKATLEHLEVLRERRVVGIGVLDQERAVGLLRALQHRGEDRRPEGAAELADQVIETGG